MDLNERAVSLDVYLSNAARQRKRAYLNKLYRGWVVGLGWVFPRPAWAWKHGLPQSESGIRKLARSCTLQGRQSNIKNHASNKGGEQDGYHVVLRSGTCAFTESSKPMQQYLQQ